MKRKALLIGCSGGTSIAAGVKQDVYNYASFLKSPKGGNYFDNEIVQLLEQTKETIIKKIHEIREENNDIVFSVFTGHGAYDDIEKEERVLEIDGSSFLYESSLVNLASKQILIIDSCAGLISSPIIVKAGKNFADDGVLYQSSSTRIKYETEINKCPNQLIRLYSSYKGETSDNTEEGLGGLYSYNLIKVLESNMSPKLDIVSAHNEAAQIVMKQSLNKQHPSGIIPKLPNTLLLPGAIN